jgi:hypothetical protein
LTIENLLHILGDQYDLEWLSMVSVAMGPGLVEPSDRAGALTAVELIGDDIAEIL